MRIAILGWGSLLWEGGPDFERWHHAWQSGGPTLSLEFSRISETRLGALTLVIDEDNGTPSVVRWSLSRRRTLKNAIRDLCSREGTTPGRIGRVLVSSETSKRTARQTHVSISAWARSRQIDSVIWTDLRSNFDEQQGESFSVSAALAYVKDLGPEGKAKAAEYVWRAPDFVSTPVRSALQREPWFSETDT